MPRHESVSPEEDLSTYYDDPALRGGASSAASESPAPQAASVASTVDTPEGTVDGTAAAAAPPRRLPGQLAPVQRPMPTFPATPPPPSPPVEPASPILAAALSLFVPGAGQIYLGQTAKGGLLLAIGLLTCFGAFSAGLVNLVAAADAWLIAGRKNAGEEIGPWNFF